MPHNVCGCIFGVGHVLLQLIDHFLACCPESARRTMIRWSDSTMLSHEPSSGVYSGMIPCSKNHYHYWLLEALQK
jgi:hypothetical protein